jgi:uncharacterized lipoprotein YehR (DUF1307 family)
MTTENAMFCVHFYSHVLIYVLHILFTDCGAEEQTKTFREGYPVTGTLL